MAVKDRFADRLIIGVKPEMREAVEKVALKEHKGLSAVVRDWIEAGLEGTLAPAESVPQEADEES